MGLWTLILSTSMEGHGVRGEVLSPSSLLLEVISVGWMYFRNSELLTVCDFQGSEKDKTKALYS